MSGKTFPVWMDEKTLLLILGMRGADGKPIVKLQFTLESKRKRKK